MWNATTSRKVVEIRPELPSRLDWCPKRCLVSGDVVKSIWPPPCPTTRAPMAAALCVVFVNFFGGPSTNPLILHRTWNTQFCLRFCLLALTDETALCAGTGGSETSKSKNLVYNGESTYIIRFVYNTCTSLSLSLFLSQALSLSISMRSYMYIHVYILIYIHMHILYTVYICICIYVLWSHVIQLYIVCDKMCIYVHVYVYINISTIYNMFFPFVCVCYTVYYGRMAVAIYVETLLLLLLLVLPLYLYYLYYIEWMRYFMSNMLPLPFHPSWALAVAYRMRIAWPWCPYARPRGYGPGPGLRSHQKGAVPAAAGAAFLGLGPGPISITAEHIGSKVKQQTMDRQ